MPTLTTPDRRLAVPVNVVTGNHAARLSTAPIDSVNGGNAMLDPLRNEGVDEMTK
jgi:hypothetical protein